MMIKLLVIRALHHERQFIKVVRMVYETQNTENIPLYFLPEVNNVTETNLKYKSHSYEIKKGMKCLAISLDRQSVTPKCRISDFLEIC